MDSVAQSWSQLRHSIGSRPYLSKALASSLIGTLGLLVALAVKDYRDFLALGRGGVPYNVFGWALVSLVLRPFTLRKKDVRWTGDYPDTGASKEILALPSRKGPRPEVGGIAPHRQLSQHAPKAMREPMEATVHNLQAANPTLLETKLSHYERFNEALYVHSSLLQPSNDNKNPNLPETAIMAQGEAGHIHPDLSVHLYFSPADAKVVIEKGWAERHRLARQQPWYFGRMKYVLGLGSTYLMVYGPRDEEELETFRALVLGSVRFMTGGREIVTG